MKAFLIGLLALSLLVLPAAPVAAADNGQNLVNAGKGIALGEVWNGGRAFGNQMENQVKQLGPAGVVTGFLSGVLLGAANIAATVVSDVATIVTAGFVAPVANGWDSGPAIPIGK